MASIPKTFADWANARPADLFIYDEQARRFYDDNQPRDDHGRWTNGNGPPPAPPEAHPDRHGPISETLRRVLVPWYPDDKAASAELKAILGDGTEAHVAFKPVTQRAARVTADVLKEMKDKGYHMPDAVTVTNTGEPAETGASGTTTTFDGHGRLEALLEITVPSALPDDANIDKAVSAAFSGSINSVYGDIDRFTVRNMRDVVIHEMGHVQARSTIGSYDWPAVERGWDRKWEGKWRAAAFKVSNYAAANPTEFVAEAFTRMYRGEKLADDSMSLYRDLKGPAIR